MLSSYLQELKKKSGRGRTMERLSDEDVDRIAIAVVEKAREDVDIRDVIIGSAMGEGAIPVYGRETRKEVCHACRIDPSKPLEAGNVMATTGNAFGILSQEEVRNWCSEIIEVADGRCARARSIREAARECKEKYPEDTEAFFRCYIPAFSQTTRESNPARVHFDRADIDSAIAAARRLKSDRNLYVFATHLGYTIDGRPPPGMQQYVVVHPDGTTETIKPSVGGNPDAKEPWQMTRREAFEAWSKNMDLPLEQRVPTPNMFFGLTDKELGKEAWSWFEQAVKRGDFFAQTDFQHRWAVLQALKEGKPVPPEVLAEYPDLLKGVK